MPKRQLFPPGILRVLLIVMVALGLFFRFTNLDQKLLDGDECITSVRSAGYSREMVDLIPRNQLIGPEEMEGFRQIKPNSRIVDSLRVNATGAPQHTPLYFLLNRFWTVWFGNDLIAMRSLTALLGLLALPAIYWLCLELFDSPAVATLGASLLAVSPVHLVHAQNARPRTLWILMILLSSAAVVRATRLNRKRDWGLYGVMLVLHLYSFLFSIFVVIAQGIYVLFQAKRSENQVIKPFLGTGLLAIAAFSPWLAVIVLNRSTARNMTSWMDYSPPFLDLLGSWAKNLCDIFWLWHGSYEASFGVGETAFTIGVGLTSLALVIYAFYFLCRNTSRQAWLLVLLLPAVAAIAIVLPDLLLGGLRSAIGRYVFPCVLGIQVAIAYLLATKTTVVSSTRHPRLWQAVTVAVLSIGVLSCGVSSQTNRWNGMGDFVFESSALINQAERPLLVSDDDIIFGLMPLNHRLQPHVKLFLVDQPEALSIPEGFSDIFLYYPTEALMTALEARPDWAVRPAYQHGYLNAFVWKATEPETLWKLEKQGA